MGKKMTAWERVEVARSPKRKTAIEYVENIFDEFVELHGDRGFKDDKAIVCGLANIGEQNFTIVAQQKGRNTKENIARNFGMPNPESYRKSIRFMKQAEKFKRPIITFKIIRKKQQKNRHLFGAGDITECRKGYRKFPDPRPAGKERICPGCPWWPGRSASRRRCPRRGCSDRWKCQWCS